MGKNRVIAGVLSIIIPGLGQMYKGEGNKGAAILAAAIVIGNLNIMILPLISIANPEIPPSTRALWAYWIPRVTHDVLAFWSIAFWIWVVVDAFTLRKG
jgi:hypothetical protein